MSSCGAIVDPEANESLLPFTKIDLSVAKKFNFNLTG